jgi:hypothetical protein
MLDIVQNGAQVDAELRIANQARLRELALGHADEVAVFSAHDPWEFGRYRRS